MGIAIVVGVFEDGRRSTITKAELDNRICESIECVEEKTRIKINTTRCLDGDFDLRIVFAKFISDGFDRKGVGGYRLAND